MFRAANDELRTRNEKGEIDEIMGIVGALVAFDPPLR
jgi:hypothetical protein